MSIYDGLSESQILDMIKERLPSFDVKSYLLDVLYKAYDVSRLTNTPAYKLYLCMLHNRVRNYTITGKYDMTGLKIKINTSCSFDIQSLLSLYPSARFIYGEDRSYIEIDIDVQDESGIIEDTFSIGRFLECMDTDDDCYPCLEIGDK